jgi:hypothetical protein
VPAAPISPQPGLVERFSERFGYMIVGRHPGAIRLAPGDDRDELILIFRV